MRVTAETLAGMCRDIEESGGSIYVAITQYMRAYARASGVSLTLVPHLAHIGYLFYTVGKRTVERQAEETP